MCRVGKNSKMKRIENRTRNLLSTLQFALVSPERISVRFVVQRGVQREFPLHKMRVAAQKQVRVLAGHFEVVIPMVPAGEAVGGLSLAQERPPRRTSTSQQVARDQGPKDGPAIVVALAVVRVKVAAAACDEPHVMLDADLRHLDHRV